MINRIIRFIFVVTAAIVITLNAEELPISQLKHVADGLNIEGGTIAHQYLKRGQVWSNLCVVLDRPFEDGIEWQELTNRNSYPLKETSILEYNEAQVNYAYAIIMHHYITKAHEIIGKPEDQTAKILIQVHRNSSGPNHIDLLEKLLIACYPELAGTRQTSQSESRSKYELFSYEIPHLNVNIDYCHGAAPQNLGELGRYRDSDIVLSFSLVAGFHEEWISGSLLVPDIFIPFTLKEGRIEAQNSYTINNHLKQALFEIVSNQDNAVLEKINHHFSSLNPQKGDLKARKFYSADFKNAILLQADGMFNPSQLPQIITIDRIN